MKFSKALLSGVLLVLAAPASGGPASNNVLDFKTTLSGAGLDYSGIRTFRIEKNHKRGDWKGPRPAFWTVTASDGTARLRLELTGNISRAKAEKTMAERFLRIDALYSGGAAYPGMITTEFEVPETLRPADIASGPGGNRAKALAATPNMAYGAGAEDLVSHRGILGYIYCDGTGTLAQIEFFFPKAEFSLEAARRESAGIACVNKPAAKTGGPK